MSDCAIKTSRRGAAPGSGRTFRACGVALLLTGAALLGPGLPEALGQDGDSAPQIRNGESDLIPDPAVTNTRFSNGMHVAVMRNGQPPSTVSLRLSIRVGSLNEAANERGLAHFVEHMAFNGSRSVPEGELTRRLSRLGIAFGSDANAQTGQAFTTFALDLPSADAASVEECLFLLRDMMGELLFDPAAVEREKGVVLAEIRRSDTFERRRRDRELSFLVPGAYSASRMPLGEAEAVAAATPERLQALYRRFYRPERATLVVVGDVDPVAMTATVERWFGDWKGVGEPGADPDISYQLSERKPQAIVSIFPDGSDVISVYALSPYRRFPDTAAGQRERILLAVALSAVNQRLATKAAGDDPPFRSARLFASDLFKSASYAAGSISVAPGRWKTGLAFLEQTWRSALLAGFTRQEIDQQVAALRAVFANAAQAEATRRSDDLAAQLVQTMQDEETFSTSTYLLQLFEAWAPGITPETVADVFRQWMKRDIPLFTAWSTREAPTLAEDIVAAWAASETSAAGIPATARALTFRYTDFGTPGRVASDRPLAGLDARAIAFDNGVRLTLKRTTFQKGAVLVSLRVGKGAVALEGAPFGLAQLVGAYTAGGLEAHSVEDLQAMFAGRSVQVGFSIFPDYFGGVYATRPEDLRLQLQIAAAYLAHPGYRPEAERKWREAIVLAWPQFDANARATFSTQGTRLLVSGDRRFGSSPDDGVIYRSFTELKAYLDPILQDAPVEIAIVGDIDEAVSIAAVASTFGALPRRPEAASSAGRPVVFAHPDAPIVLHHRGETSQALLKFYWPVDIDPDADTQGVRVLGVLSTILQNRLLDTVRERMSASYAPAAGFSSSAVYPGLSYFYLEIEARPSDAERLRGAVAALVADLREGKIDSDELERARRPALEQLAQHANSNAYWLSVVAQAQSRPDRAARLTLEATEAALREVTLADLQDAAVKWLEPSNLREIDVLPAGAPADGD
jgi:zinc protease